jgi:hypothetical protein
MKTEELIDFADENNKILKFIQTLNYFFQESQNGLL